MAGWDQFWSNFWIAPAGSLKLFIMLFLAFIIPLGIFFLLRNVGPQARKIIVGASFFLTGLVYVLYFLWPQPVHRQPNEVPRNLSESVSFFLTDTIPVVGTMANVIGGFLLGLGVFSVVRVHGEKVVKKHKDRMFSIVLLVSVVLMIIFGYWDYYTRSFGSRKSLLTVQENWTFVNYAYDFLFNWLLQQMDATMFSLIAFYILSAAYRAFRIRSIEASVLLGTALLLVLKTTTMFANFWATLPIIRDHPNATLESLTTWLTVSLQNSSIRGVDFGVGIGLLAMALRLWLNLEKQGIG